MTSQTPDMQAVLKRLERLERQNRRLKQGGIVALIAIGALLLMGQAAPKSHVVEAEKFILRDAKGVARAELSSKEGFMSQLILNDAHGDMRAKIFVANDGQPALAFVGGEHDVKVAIAEMDGVPTMRFYGSGGAHSILGPDLLRFSDKELRLWLGVSDGKPHLSLEDKEGFSTIVQPNHIAINEDSSPSGKSVSLSILPSGAGFTVDSGTGPRADLLVLRSGPSLLLSDKAGFSTTLGVTELETPRTGESHTTSAASLVMVDKDRNVIWRAP